MASAATDPFLQLSPPVVTNGQVQFTLTGESGVRYVVESSTNAQSWLPMWTNSDSSITRSITLPASNAPTFYRAWRYRLPLFPGAITAKQNINLLGSNVYLDSFDSADPAKSTLGEYDPTKAQANGDVAGELGLINAAAYIHGKLRIGQNGSYDLGTNGLVGPIGWSGPGIFSPDWIQSDFRFTMPSVSPPYTGGFGVPAGSGTNYTILMTANYFVSGNFKPTGSPKAILVVGNAKLYVTGDFIVPSTWEIKIAPGASLQIYVGTESGPAVTGEFSSVNTTTASDAGAFGYYGLHSNTYVVWAGNNTFKGTVYAPQAAVAFGGGGSTVFDFHGAVVAETVSIYGHFNFHYDENLKRKPPQR